MQGKYKNFYLILVLIIFIFAISGFSVYFWENFINKTNLQENQQTANNHPKHLQNIKTEKKNINKILNHKEEDEKSITEYSLLRPEDVVKIFYTWYLNYINGVYSNGEFQNPLDSEEFENNKYLTKEFINKIYKMKKEGLHYDPILCAQDSPDSANDLILDRTQIIDNRATVVVRVFIRYPHKVELIKANGVWEINNVDCPINKP